MIESVCVGERDRGKERERDRDRKIERAWNGHNTEKE